MEAKQKTFNKKTTIKMEIKKRRNNQIYKFYQVHLYPIDLLGLAFLIRD